VRLPRPSSRGLARHRHALDTRIRFGPTAIEYENSAKPENSASTPAMIGEASSSLDRYNAGWELRIHGKIEARRVRCGALANLDMKKILGWLAVPLAGLVVLAIVSSNAATDSDAVPTSTVQVLGEYPHDPSAFSQGLAIEGQTLFEGTGKYGGSSLRKIDLETGRIASQVALNKQYFGEGITVLGDRIYQLTWRERVCLVYEKETLKYLGAHKYTGEGWGLADDEKQLYLSDGSSTIRVLDADFKVLQRITVRVGRRRLDNLNELEFVNGEILANIWYEDRIARIDPKTGQVVGWIDCRNVYPLSQRPDREHVLNGIAHDAESGRIFITGKNWPKIFEIEIQP
jgi:glutamine cyclotransferase